MKTENDVLISLPGFGFYSHDWVTKFKSHLDNLPYDSESNNSQKRNEMKCQIVTSMFEEEQRNESELWCRPLWDKASCFPATRTGVLSIIPCMAEYNGIPFNTNDNATRECFLNGSWADKTNYDDCGPLKMDEFFSEIYDKKNWVMLIYSIGYSISSISLIIALCILLGFREIRCLRNKIHTNLFLTFLLSNSCWILTAFVQHYWLKDDSMVALCINIVLVRYFHLTTFFLMFVEGLYLFLQVKVPLSVSIVKLRHYLFIGWGIPVLVIILWIVFTLVTSITFDEEEYSTIFVTGGFDLHQNFNNLDKCPFVRSSGNVEWIYKAPVFIVLGCNILFLIWIMKVVIYQIRGTNTTTDRRNENHHHRQHWKAAKALLIIIPLLGITYPLTVVGPNHPLAFNIFIHFRAILLSTQGFIITLPYCFLNNEVQSVLKVHWHRWKEARQLFSSTQSTRNSISMAGFYSTVTAIDNVSLRESRLNHGTLGNCEYFKESNDLFPPNTRGRHVSIKSDSISQQFVSCKEL